MEERYLIFLNKENILFEKIKNKYEIFSSIFHTYSYIQTAFSQEDAFYFKMKYNDIVKEILTTEEALQKYGTISYTWRIR